jgi:hypothetical protein
MGQAPMDDTFQSTFPGDLAEVARVRAEIREYLAGCPAADDATLILSEFAANAVVHSASRGRFFIVRAELYPDYIWVEVEDLGGPWPWLCRQREGGFHGLAIVQTLVGPDNWGVETAIEGAHIAWARLQLALTQTPNDPDVAVPRPRRAERQVTRSA